MHERENKGVKQVKMFEIGRLCVKIAGRDANKKCVIVDKIDDKFVLIDGQTRRRKCNIIHLKPLDKVVKIKKNASHDAVIKELKKLKVPVSEKKGKRKKKAKKEKGTEEVKKKGDIKEKKVKKEKEGKKKVLGLFRRKGKKIKK